MVPARAGWRAGLLLGRSRARTNSGLNDEATGSGPDGRHDEERGTGKPGLANRLGKRAVLGRSRQQTAGRRQAEGCLLDGILQHCTRVTADQHAALQPRLSPSATRSVRR